MALTKVSRGLLSTGIVDNSNATAITLNADESATFAGSVIMQGATTTIGNAAANTNVGLVLNGVASKAQRIAFNEGATNRWMLGQGAASETSAFELYNAGGVIVLSVDRTSNVSTFAAGAVFNEGSYDSDFRVESNGNANMLFVDAGNDKVILGGSSQDSAGTLTFNSGTGLIRHSTSAGTAKDHLLYSISGVNNGFQTTVDTSNNITYKFHTGGNALAASFGTTESVFNENSLDRDFRVESNTNAHALFLDAGNDVLTLGYNARNGAFVDKAATGFQIGTPGVDDNGGQIFMAQSAAQNAWKSILSCHDANATGALIFLHAVRTGDQNRSGAMMIRYAYNQAFTIMSQSLQNMIVELRVSSNVLQYRITTGGPYTVSLQIMANG